MPFKDQEARRTYLNSDRRKAAAKKYRQANPDKQREYARRYRAAHPEKYLAKARKVHAVNPARFLLSRARDRAREQNIPFNLVRADILIPEKCPLLGIALYRTPGTVTPNTPSLDKIIPSLGYVKGNVQVISYRANTIKNDASLAEMQLLVKNWEAQAA
jgi:hypothetical protein